MAKAISLRTTLASDDLRIPELRPFVGKKVQIIVVEDDPLPFDGAGSPEPERKLGSLRGLLTVPDDFDDPLPDELLRAFEGEGDG